MASTKPIVCIENVVASANVNQDINLQEIIEKFPEINYDPKTFPGAIFKINSPKTTTLIFSTGKLVCTGGKSESQVFRAIHQIHSLLEEKDLMMYN